MTGEGLVRWLRRSSGQTTTFRPGIRPDALGRHGVCPFCNYIGPPLMCACVTTLTAELMKAALLLIWAPDTILLALEEQTERIRVLNELLAEERAS